MPDPVSSSTSRPLMSLPPDPEPNMSVNPAASGGGSSTSGASSSAPPAPSVSSTAAPSSSSPPTASPAVPAGTKVLVTRVGTFTAQGQLGVAEGAGAGNFGARLSAAEAQVTYTTPGGGTSVTFSRRLVTAEADIGTNNADGSQGAHIKVGGALVAEEITVKSDAVQFSIGADAGAGLEASSGTRDIDADGNAEYCIRGGSKVVVGACIEPGQFITDAKKGFDALKRAVTSAGFPGGHW